MEERRLLTFREYLLAEGDVWTAFCHGCKTGLKAYRHKRSEQKQSGEKKALAEKILSAEGKDLEQLVKKIVANGYTVRNGSVVQPDKQKSFHGEILECTSTRAE